MGIEGGPRGEFDAPRPNTIKIEGEIESSFPEIDMDQATHVALPNHLVWPDARLTFQHVGGYIMPQHFGMTSHIPLYTGQLEYRGQSQRKRKSNLSLLTSKQKPILFTGTTNGFYAHDPLMAGAEEPFYVVGLQVDELKTNMSHIAAIWHELGHVMIFHTNSDVQLLQAALSLNENDLPNIAMALAYGNELAWHMQCLVTSEREIGTVNLHGMICID